MITRPINSRLLVVLLLVLALGSGVAFLLHAAQMHRHARTLMARARQAEADGQLDRAMLALQRYLVFAPEDNAARARCGEIMEQLAVSDRERWRAVEVYEQVLYREPSRQDIRRRLARLALTLGWTSEAHAHLDILLREQPKQGDLEYLLAQCQEESGDYPLAAVSYENAIRDDPHQIDGYLRLAQLYRARLDRPERAEAVYDRMVRENDQSAPAYLARALQRMNRGALAEAGHDLERARELAPKDPSVLLASADLERRRGRFAEARRWLQMGREVDPGNLGMHLALAALESQRGHKREAVACLRQGLQALPDRPDLMLYLTETLLELDDEPAAEEVIQRLRGPSAPPGLAHYLDGLLQLHRKKWSKAILILDEVAQSPDSSSGLASRASVVLGRCHEQLGDSDRQLAALRRAVVLDASSASAQLALAAALRRMGRIEEALEQYREVVSLPQAPDESWVLLGQLLLQRNRALPARKRRWQEVENVLQRAARLPALEIPLAVLRAEVRQEQGHPQEAQAVLEKASAAHPGAAELWTARADLALRRGEAARSFQILEDARRSLGNRGELNEAAMALALSQPARRANQTLRNVEKQLENLPVETRLRLRGELAAAYARIGKLSEGRRVCRSLAERAPMDLPSRLALLDLALQSGDEALLARITADVRRLEGDEGTGWRYGEAARLLLKARNGDAQAAEQARLRVADLVRRRPDWPRGALLQAYLHEQDGALTEAANAYSRAFRGGERRPGLGEHLTALLVEQGRLDEADEVVRQCEQQSPPSAELARLGVEIALRQHSQERALELAPLAVANDTNDYRQLIWLGQVLTQAGRPSEGEEALRQAVRRRGDLAETWLALIAHLVKLDQVGEAEAVRADMRRHLPAEQAPLAEASAAEVLSEWDKADRFYQQSLSRSPADGLVLQRAAHFYLRLNREKQAEPLLRRMLAAEATVPAVSQAWARRQLALLLAFAGDDDKYRQALALLVENRRHKEEAFLDRRARLLVQGTRAEERRAALHQLEESAKTQPFAAEELFCLARLYEADNDETAARERMLDLLSLEKNNPEYLAHHIERLLQQRRKDEARAWLLRLQKLEPDSPRVRTFAAGLREMPMKP
jgi:tetratricopeptide (TPR) repeat protein